MAHSSGRSSTSRAWAEGGLVFAATMLMIMGLYQVFMGIAAIAKDQFFVVAPNYVYSIDTTAWGWVHLGIGIIAAITGFFLFTQATWARWVGIAIAGISAVANFFFLPYYPIWSLVIIATDVFVIWALASVGSRDRTPIWGDEMAPPASAGMPMSAPMAQGEAMPTHGWPANPPPTPTYDTTPSKGMAQPTGTSEAEAAQHAAQQGMAGMTPPRPPTPAP